MLYFNANYNQEYTVNDFLIKCERFIKIRRCEFIYLHDMIESAMLVSSDIRCIRRDKKQRGEPCGAIPKFSDRA